MITKKLFNYSQEFEKSISSLIDNETGEILDVKEFDKIQAMHTEQKNEYLLNLARYVLELEAANEIYQKRIDSFNVLKKRNSDSVAFFKKVIESNLSDEYIARNKLRDTDDGVEIFLTISDKEKIENEKLIPKKYMYNETIEKIDSKKIKRELKSGEKIPGAILKKTKKINIRGL